MSTQLPEPRRLRLGPRKFPFFPKLPLELCLCIWEFALPDAQLVSFSTVYSLDEDGERVKDWEGRYVTERDIVASYKVPSLLHTCKDARKVAQSVYKECFSHLLGNNGVWMDVTRDIICFEDPTTCGFFFDAEKDLLYQSMNDRQIKLPIEEELAGIAFRNFPRELWPAAPRILSRMGKPKNMYLLRPTGRVTSEHLHQIVNMDIWWLWERKKAAALNYDKPKLHCLTYKQMKTELVSSISRDCRDILTLLQKKF